VKFISISSDLYPPQSFVLHEAAFLYAGFDFMTISGTRTTITLAV
jgi:hypothetical protein